MTEARNSEFWAKRRAEAEALRVGYEQLTDAEKEAWKLGKRNERSEELQAKQNPEESEIVGNFQTPKLNKDDDFSL